MSGLSRRDCLRVGLAAGGALWVGGPDASAGSAGASSAAAARQTDLAVWLRVAGDGAITLLSNASEMGQGSSSALAQIVAEELEQPWGEIGMEMAPVDAQYFGLWNDYVTGGSATVRGMFEKLRIAGATARQLLITAAARHWGVDEERCVLSRRSVVDRATGRSRSFGELAAAAAPLTLAQPPSPLPRERWKIIGQPLLRLDLRAKVDGTAIFGIDAGPADARIATLRHAPRLGAEPRGKLPPDSPKLRFVRLPGAVAAVSDSYWSARQALDSATLDWSEPDGPPLDDELLRRRLSTALDSPGEILWIKPEEHDRRRRDNDAALASAARVFERRYETPLLAHTCMEPMNATARVTSDAATLWVPTQVQASMRREVAKALSMPETAVTIHTTLLGGGFGRRLETDYGVKAALLSRAIGEPVKLLWSREEDIRRDWFRQSAMARFRAALDDQGQLRGIRLQLAALNGCTPGGVPPYPLENLLITNAVVPSPLTLGAWRSVECNHNTFFLESFLDELALEVRRQPLELRRALLASRPRSLRVLNAAVAESGMESATPGRHFGVAMSMVFGSECAQVIEVSIPEDHVVCVHRVTCAFDCGTAVNPDSVRAQIEGSIIMGLSAAMFERINVAEGGVVQSNFHDYPILRFGQVPDIRILLLESPAESLGGAGEPALPPVAPALCNAIFAAGGGRVRRLPLGGAGGG